MAAHLAGMAFIPYYNQIMTILETDKELKKTMQGIAGQMAWSAGGVMVGGAFGGPVGAMLGGIAGSVYGYSRAGDYSSMMEVLKNLSNYEKEELVDRVRDLVGSGSIEALISFVGQQVNREMFATIVHEFTKQHAKGG